MEPLQFATNKTQISHTKTFIPAFGFTVLPFTENIGHRASIYIEVYTLVSNLRAGDAILAATATENNMILVTGNAKHFKVIRDLRLKTFKP